MWDKMIIKPNREAEFRKLAMRGIINKERYVEIQNATAYDGLGKEGEGVPWYMLYLLHLRESNANFSTYLGNGQPLSRRTTIVPKGRGPFTGPKAFLNGALDALRIDGLSAVLDWRLEKILYYCELFNGAGYNNLGLPSPYIWGGTNIQRPGKYVADHVWSSTKWDTQPGCAPILYMMAKLDPTIKFTRES
jgi:lysozyme family protein